MHTISHYWYNEGAKYLHDARANVRGPTSTTPIGESPARKRKSYKYSCFFRERAGIFVGALNKICMESGSTSGAF